MTYISIFIAGLALGIFACLALYALIVAFRPTPPTMYRRKVEPPPVISVAPVEEGSIRYEFLGQTGEEQL